MKVYFEFVFLINFLLDFMILYGTKRILKINRSIFRICMGAIVGSSSTFLLFVDVNGYELFLCKIFLSSFIILVSFGRNSFIRNIIYFYLVSIIIGGTIYLFDLNGNYYFNVLFIVFACPLIIYLIKQELFKYKSKYQNKYYVRIYYKNKLYKLEGFIDTGNRLLSPYKKECVIITNLNIKYDNGRVIYVPYKALNTSGVIPCVKPDKVVVDNREFANCLIGIAKSSFELDGSNCILPNIFKEDLC